jgi:hypothetical protein
VVVGVAAARSLGGAELAGGVVPHQPAARVSDGAW